mgnify:CR=1 FL=1
MMLLSIIPSAPSSGAYFLAGLLSLLMIVSVWKVRTFPHKLSNEGTVVALFLCLLFYLFPMGGTDFYDYKELVETAGFTDISSIPLYYLHYEKPYYYIINIVNNNYFLFRLVVWGGSLFLYWQTAKRLKIDKSTFAFYLCICIVPLTAVSRVCLSYALAFFGFSFFAQPITRKRSNLISFILGSSIILSSLFFHRSAIFLLAILPLSLFNFNKKTIWLFALAIPTLIVLAYTHLFDFIFNFDQTDTSLLDSETAMIYLNSDRKGVFGLGQWIEFSMKYGSHIAMLILIVKSILNNSYTVWPKQVQKFANATLYITMLASALLLAPGATTYKTFERLIAFSYVPQSFLLAYLLKTDYDKKLVNIVSLLITSYVVYGILYYNFYFGLILF